MQDNFDIPSLPQRKTKKMKLDRNLLTFSGIGLLILIVLGFLAFRYFGPFGMIVSYKFDSVFNRDKASKIEGVETDVAFSPGKDGILQIPQQILKRDKAVFSLSLASKKIDGIWVNFKFKGNPKEVKIGVNGNTNNESIYKPLYNKTLEDLGWKKIRENNTILWQKNETFKTLKAFLSHPPLNKSIVTYFFDSKALAYKAKSSILQETLTIKKQLRGPHIFFVKVDKNPLILNVTKKDLNLYSGEDVLLIQVFKDDAKIAEKVIPDDGVSDNSKLEMPAQKEEIRLDNLDAGIYKVVLNEKVDKKDLFINEIETNQSFLVFSSPLFITDAKPTTVWTDSKNITAVTPHQAGIQTIKLNDKYDLAIEKDGITYPFDLAQISGLPVSPSQKISTQSAKNSALENTDLVKLNKLSIPKNDLIISGNGYFSFSDKSFFNPALLNGLDVSGGNVDFDKADYIIADYAPVKENGDWKVTQVHFGPSDVKVDGDKLYFSLESPGLEDTNGELVIDNLEVTVKKPGWFETEINTQKENTPKITVGATIIEEFVNKIKEIFYGIFPKGDNKNEKALNDKVSPTPVKKPTPTTKSASASFSIIVSNGGGENGAAGKFAQVLEQAGYKNVEVNKINLLGYNDAILKYKKDKSDNTQKIIIQKISELLKKDYTSVKEDFSATKSGIITIILGQKFIPTKVISPSAKLTPTKKP